MSNDLILEIGAGDGALSTRLAPRVSGLLAVELDRDCLGPLQASLGTIKSATVIGEDILSLDLEGLLLRSGRPDQRIRIVGNLPYNISTVIISRLLHSRLPITDLIFMVQLEVAQRLTASRGTKEYGFFSVECQHLSVNRLAFKVPPACFVPRPRVVSAMVTLEPRKTPRDSVTENHFIALAKAAFAYRRKTLANSLARNESLAPIAEELLREARIDGTRRAEEISVEEYEHLAQLLCRMRNNVDGSFCPAPKRQRGTRPMVP